ncbi:hypothetical protein RKLH11_4231 [Rhodobacteraceae bacterium KLH11]|nr:hypothetical protein RKLH11_4231 [Rhodobacteraceae bacterium KLH11]
MAETTDGSGKMARSGMSDLEWDFIKRVLPNKSRGVLPANSRSSYGA